jgi:hypothetical protein
MAGSEHDPAFSGDVVSPRERFRVIDGEVPVTSDLQPRPIFQSRHLRSIARDTEDESIYADKDEHPHRRPNRAYRSLKGPQPDERELRFNRRWQRGG